MKNPYTQTQNVYEPLFEETYLPDEEYEVFNITMTDDVLDKMLVQSLDSNVNFWEQKPWELHKTDKDNTNFLLGDQLDDKEFIKDNNKFVDNRMFSSVRAILSYATGQLAQPELVPSRSDPIYIKAARDLQAALYQHASDEQVAQKTRSAVQNLITRKRGYMKLRFDPNAGMHGDIVTEVCNPEDIIIDRNAKYLDNPNVIYHRIRCSIDELCARFPKKASDIKMAFAIKQGRYSQMSRYVTYFEAWFTYLDAKNIPREGVCWFVPEKHLILDKMPNPNWVYTGSDKKDKKTNVMAMPPKPFVWFNYMNMGHSFIDDTCLFDQARPMQEMLNRRGAQLNQNIDYMNGRWIASKKAFAEGDAQKFINKGSRTIALVDADDVRTALTVETPQGMPRDVFESVVDFRNEIDQMMGTPSVFKGAQPTSQDTLGRDVMIKQQAGALQDDLVRSIAMGMETYYTILLQMMRVYYTDDYWFQVKGGDGEYDFILVNGDTIDSDVRIGIQVDSTLPLDKAQVRATAMDLWKSGEAIDYRTFMEDLGLPDPEMRTERYLRSKLDPLGYLKSVEVSQMNDEAEVDIMLLINKKVPQERDDYDEDYINYYNQFMTTNRFQKLDPDAQQRITGFLMIIQHLAQQTANLQGAMLDEAQIVDAPVTPPMPARQIRIAGQLDPAESAQIAGVQAPPTGAAPPTPQAPPTGNVPQQ